jgi:hypothetical protein
MYVCTAVITIIFWYLLCRTFLSSQSDEADMQVISCVLYVNDAEAEFLVSLACLTGEV